MNENDIILIKQAIDHAIVGISNSIINTNDVKTRENLRELNKEYYRLIDELDSNKAKDKK